MDSEAKYIVGIDEVGRGPIAGPVAVCAFVIKDSSFTTNPKDKKLPKLKDSKKLTKKQRVTWFNYLKDAKGAGLCDYAVSFVSSESIDKFGIVKCIQKALNESLEKVAAPEILFVGSSDEGGRGARPLQKEILATLHVYLDGGLKAPVEYINQETIIRGDELHPVISMASIMAKVSRDRIMMNYAKIYPEYGFESHVGYGTKSHYSAIKKHGQTPIHRKTFIH
jgi:ribonuclease HII